MMAFEKWLQSAQATRDRLLRVTKFLTNGLTFASEPTPENERELVESARELTTVDQQTLVFLSRAFLAIVGSEAAEEEEEKDGD